MFKIVNDNNTLTIEEMYEKYPNTTFIYEEVPDENHYTKGKVMCYIDTTDDIDYKKLNNYYNEQTANGVSVAIAVSEFSNLTARVINMGVL